MTDLPEEKRSRGGRLWLGVLVAAVLVGGGFFVKKAMDSKPKPRRDTGFTMVSLPPPPPPRVAPTPPPVATPPPAQQQIVEEQTQMIEQAPVTEADTQKSDPEPAQESLGTGITGEGPGDGFGLSGRGDGVIGGRGTGGGDRSRWGWYAAEVQGAITNALRRNRSLRTASLRVTVRVWPDANGRITRAALAESSGDTRLDDILTREVLNGLQLQSPPPPGMPSPIVLRVSARRPN